MFGRLGSKSTRDSLLVAVVSKQAEELSSAQIYRLIFNIRKNAPSSQRVRTRVFADSPEMIKEVNRSQRRDIAALKQHVAALERQMKTMQRSAGRAPQPAAENAEAGGHRFVAKGFKTLRRRLGLSAAQIGRLLSVSEQTVYNWETRAAVPRRTHLPAIAQLRGMGKRRVAEMLSASSSSAKGKQAR